jgi:hypothetical protein
MKFPFLKGVILGIAALALVVFSSTAVAGSSSAAATCGQAWVLGTSNSCSTTTNLTGAAAGPELLISNSNGAVGAYAIAANGASSATPVISGANSSTGIGFRGQSVGGIGAFGAHTASTGTDAGVRGDTSSTDASANGVLGLVRSTSPGANSAGVRGINNGTGGLGIGVYGSQAGSGFGVYGTAPSGYGGVFNGGYAGAYGTGGSFGGLFYGGPDGVYASGSTFGVESYGGSVGGYFNGAGIGSEGVGPWGVEGASNDASSGYGGVFFGGPNGVYGSGSNIGGQFYGGPTGVYGTGTSDGGLFAASSGSGGDGVAGSTDTGTGSAGVRGTSTASNGNGGIFTANTGSVAYGVWGISSEGQAGHFDGNVVVTGTLTKGAGSFRIDNPLDPAHSYLQHSFVESPDMMNVYNGNVTTDAHGFATVKLPKYFMILNRDFRYQLTVLGRSFARAIVWTKIANNRFTIRTDEANVQVSWQVTGIRHDPYANAHRIKVFLPKPVRAQGFYQNPGVYGQPATKGLDYAYKPGAMRALARAHATARPTRLAPTRHAQTTPRKPTQRTR